MRFHVFFLTITIQKKRLSETEMVQEQQYKKIMDDIRDCRSKYYTNF